MPRLMPHYLMYYLPGFHPWKAGRMTGFERWQRAYRESGGNPIAAADAI
jgi:hypothetical protein